MKTVYWLLLKNLFEIFFANQFLFGSYIFLPFLKSLILNTKKCIEDDFSHDYSTVYSPVIGVQFTVSSRIQDTFQIFSE